MAKKSTKKASINKNKTSFGKFFAMLLGALLLVFCVCLILSMIGYTPTDESFNVSNSDKINNFMGRFGSYSSDFIVNSYGMAIFVFLIPLFVWGYLLIKNQKILEFKIRLFAVLLGILTLSGVFYQTMPIALEKINLLGKFSHMLPSFLIKVFNDWNIKGYKSAVSLIILTTIALMSFNLATGITFKHWAKLIKTISITTYKVLVAI